MVSIVVCVCFQVVNVVTNQCVRRLGVIENTERFLHVALFQGAAEVGTHCTREQCRPKDIAQWSPGWTV